MGAAARSLGSGFALLAPTHDPSRGTPLVAHGFSDQPTLARKGAPGSPAVSEPSPTYQQFNLTSDGQ
jgi:hypothetical protein